MNIFGIVVTLVYITLVVILRWGDFHQLATMELNNFGDFFAGVFGPLTLFWLILGYVQQQKELRQNTEALKLQHKELKNSVEQHKELVKATWEQVAAEREGQKIEMARVEQGSLPYFIISKACLGKISGGTKVYEMRILNTGKSAASINITTQPVLKFVRNQELSRLTAEKQHSLFWNVGENDVDPKEIEVTIKCKDSKSQPYKQVIKLKKVDKNSYETVKD